MCKIALAKQISCFWPTEKFKPAPTMTLSKPPSFLIDSHKFTLSKAFQISCSRNSPKGSRFSLKLPLKRNGSCGIQNKRELNENKIITLFCCKIVHITVRIAKILLKCRLNQLKLIQNEAQSIEKWLPVRSFSQRLFYQLHQFSLMASFQTRRILAVVVSAP